ncbi:hypothetical protein [Bacillus marinisedimentorum]|uniref:hypothetical protein n=1 Tax=Bacillus marinisedimentorum TaxID=1821260 RepID=UPI0007DF296E|nr:hypothetical protein [Bacillus marinisedimentorum]
MNTLKSHSGKSGIVGVCDCGYKQEFQPIKDYKIPLNEQLRSFELKDTFICPMCHEKFDYLGEIKESTKSKLIPYLFFVSIAAVFLFVGTIFISDVLNEQQDKNEFYKTGNPDDMTNKELEEFLDWKDKKDKEEWENKKAFE